MLKTMYASVCVCVQSMLVNVNYCCGEGKTETSLQILKQKHNTYSSGTMQRLNAIAMLMRRPVRHGSAEPMERSPNQNAGRSSEAACLACTD